MTGKGVDMVTMRRSGDCGIATLSMLLHLPYAEVSFVARANYPKCFAVGLGLREAERIAQLLDRPTSRVYRHKDYLLNATGMLGTLFKGSTCWGHWVYIKAGVIVDPSGHGSVWNIDDYFITHRARPATMLVVKP